MNIILQGNKEEIWKWIRRQERITGKKIGYAGTIDDQGRRLVIIKEGTKENCPRVRTVRKGRLFERSEEISE